MPSADYSKTKDPTCGFQVREFDLTSELSQRESRSWSNRSQSTSARPHKSPLSLMIKLPPFTHFVFDRDRLDCLPKSRGHIRPLFGSITLPSVRRFAYRSCRSAFTVNQYIRAVLSVFRPHKKRHAGRCNRWRLRAMRTFHHRSNICLAASVLSDWLQKQSLHFFH